MEWQAVVFALQILLLATGWILFQKAKAELSAKAAETPVLNEVKALQRSVKQLLSEITETADQTSARLESRCQEARLVLADLDARITRWEAGQEAQREAPPAPTARAVVGRAPRKTTARKVDVPVPAAAETVVTPSETASSPPRLSPRQQVYALADAGIKPSDIARETGMSEGEVETLLGLRNPRFSKAS